MSCAPASTGVSILLLNYQPTQPVSISRYFTTQNAHIALGLCGLNPSIDPVSLLTSLGCDLVDGALYALEGNWSSAGLSVTAGFAPSFLGGVAGTMKLVRVSSDSSDWLYGSFKSQEKWQAQFISRGWTPESVSEAVSNGVKYKAENLVNKGNSATRYVHPVTGKSVVVDDVTKELLHVGGEGFLY